MVALGFKMEAEGHFLTSPPASIFKPRLPSQVLSKQRHWCKRPHLAVTHYKKSKRNLPSSRRCRPWPGEHRSPAQPLPPYDSPRGRCQGHTRTPHPGSRGEQHAAPPSSARRLPHLEQTEKKNTEVPLASPHTCPPRPVGGSLRRRTPSACKQTFALDHRHKPGLHPASTVFRN